MSTNFNRRRGVAARKPRRPRLCNFPTTKEGIVVMCLSAVRPDHNGNRCVDHR